jgi:phosphosulfolactate synthase
MEPTDLTLPERVSRPRATGVTMAIDKGLPLAYFTDLVTSGRDFLDFVKFGWGTAVVTRDLKDKMDVLRQNDVRFYLGGTLFEKYVLQDRFPQFQELCRSLGCEYVEVSNGTIDMSNAIKTKYVEQLATEFQVISEVGSKDQVASENMAPNKWIDYIRQDLAAGAQLVTLEARESGRGGICRPNGELRFGLIEEIVSTDLDIGRLLFEAPSMELQSYFIHRLGANVNLGNIAITDLVNLETIRLGLRSETLLAFEPSANGGHT